MKPHVSLSRQWTLRIGLSVIGDLGNYPNNKGNIKKKHQFSFFMGLAIKKIEPAIEDKMIPTRKIIYDI